MDESVSAPTRAGVSRRTRVRGIILAGLLALAAVAALAVSACGSSSTGAASSPQPSESALAVTTQPAEGSLDKVAWNLIIEPSLLDPAGSQNYGDSDVMANLFESLQTLNPDFSIGDGLAKMTASEDQATLVYDIDPEAKFWDGKSVTGEDAAYSLMRTWHPPATVQPLYSANFESVTSIEATGPSQVTVKLKHPDLLFEQMMATAAGVVIEKAYAKAHPQDFGTPDGGVMGSGPYTLQSWEPGASLTIVRNESYWKGVTAKTGQIDFSFLQGDSTQATALMGGAVQGMYQAPLTALDRLRTNGQVISGKTLLMFYLAPTKKQGPLQDERIRNALFLALNRQAIADKAYYGAAAAARSMVPIASYGGVTPTQSEGTGGSDAELTRAKQLVQEAGSPKEQIVICFFPAISESTNVAMRAIVEAGTQIGLNMRYKTITMGQYIALFAETDGWKAVNCDAFATQWILPVADPLSLYSVWASPSDYFNYGGFVDPKATELVQAASAEADVAKRNDLLSQADAELFSKLPWIPVVEPANVLYLDNTLTGPPAASVQWYYPWAKDLGAASAGQ